MPHILFEKSLEGVLFLFLLDHSKFRFKNLLQGTLKCLVVSFRIGFLSVGWGARSLVPQTCLKEYTFLVPVLFGEMLDLKFPHFALGFFWQAICGRQDDGV